MEKSNLAVHDRRKPEHSPCSACRYSHTEKAVGIGAADVLQCRRYPPTAHPVLTMTPSGPQLAGVFTVYPNAMAICGEYAPGPAMAIMNPHATAVVE